MGSRVFRSWMFKADDFPVVNVRTDHGALGDGVTDDTAAFQAAFDAADDLKFASNRNGPPVYIPAGRYVISSNLSWLNHDILGDGPFATEIFWSGESTEPCISRDAGTAKISGLRFEGSSGTQTPSVWLELAGTDFDGNAIDYGDWIEECFFVDWSTVHSVAAIRLGKPINAHLRRLRFGSGGGYAIQANVTNTGGTFQLEDFTIDATENNSDMSGFIQFLFEGIGDNLDARIATGRIESDGSFAYPNALVTLESALTANQLGIIPGGFILENITLSVGASQQVDVINQETTQTTVGAHVNLRHIRDIGSSIRSLSGGTWSSTANIPEFIPSGHIGSMYWGRPNSGSAVTNQNMWHFDRINVNGAQLTVGTGTPEENVSGVTGALFIRTDGGASEAFYVKESGVTDNGWIAK